MSDYPQSHPDVEIGLENGEDPNLQRVIDQPAELPVASLSAQDRARRRMLAAGQKPPSACACEHPAVDEDLDGRRTCVICGRAER